MGQEGRAEANTDNASIMCAHLSLSPINAGRTPTAHGEALTFAAQRVPHPEYKAKHSLVREQAHASRLILL